MKMQRIILFAVSLLTWIGSPGSMSSAVADPRVNFQADPRKGYSPLTVHFTNTSSVTDGTLVTFHWSFGDGSTSAAENPVHTYVVTGNEEVKFDVTLTVTDDHGNTDSKLDKGYITVDPPGLAAAVLPGSRSVVTGTSATAFVSVVNIGASTATAVSIALADPTLPAALAFQTTDPATNQLTGALNLPADIPAGQRQSYLVTLTAAAPFSPTDVRFEIAGVNSTPARVVSGVNTLLLSVSTSPQPDIVALAATMGGAGVVNIAGAPGIGAFSVATVNLGAGGMITAYAERGNASLPVDLALCRTDPATGVCLTPLAPSVSTTIDAGATPTFAVFVTALAPITFDPAVSRVFVRFKDEADAIRGATSVAVRTQ